MITFDFIQKLHALVKKFPERREEYQMLYPEAFKKVDITEGVEFKLSGQLFMTFMLYDGEYYFGEMKPFIQELWVKDQRFPEGKKRTIRSLAFPVEDGYEAEFQAGGCYGFRIYRYGEKRKVVNLEVDSAAEKDRIKETS